MQEIPSITPESFEDTSQSAGSTAWISGSRKFYV
jgi:hypothetical protein